MNSKFGLLVECNDIDGMSRAMQHAMFENYVDYSNDEFEKHCCQFHKKNVLQRYLNLMENLA